MLESQINFNNNILVIQAKRAPLFILIVLGFVLLAFAYIPFGVLFYTINSGKGMHVGVFLSFGLCGLLGFYLLRLILWNAFGKEVYEIHKNTINYHSDYKWFKDNKKQFQRDTLSHKLIESQDDLGFLHLEDGTTEHTSSLAVSIDQLHKIMVKLPH